MTFLDANGDPLGPAVTVGPVSLAERGGLAGVVPRQGDGLVPVGTREIFVEIRMTRVDGTYDDGYADAIELHLLDYAQ